MCDRLRIADDSGVSRDSEVNRIHIAAASDDEFRLPAGPNPFDTRRTNRLQHPQGERFAVCTDRTCRRPGTRMPAELHRKEPTTRATATTKSCARAQSKPVRPVSDCTRTPVSHDARTRTPSAAEDGRRLHAPRRLVHEPVAGSTSPSARLPPTGREIERRGRDLNPGRACTLNGFRDRPVRPLRHPSVGGIG